MLSANKFAKKTNLFRGIIYETGIGLIKPLIFDYPEDVNAANNVDAWMFGDYMLAASVEERIMNKKVIVFALILFFVFGIFAGIVPLQADGAGTTTVKIHYQRPDGDYKKWNLWFWLEGQEGQAYPFTAEDGFGKVAKVIFPVQAKRVGFIVRTDEWEKDVGEDRFIEIINGSAEIWVQSGKSEFSTKVPSVKKSDMDRSPKIVDAVINEPSGVDVEVNIPFRILNDQKEGFFLKSGEDNVIIQDVQVVGISKDGFAREVRISTKDRLAFGRKYTVYKKGYGEMAVVLGNVFGSKEFQEMFSYDGNDLGANYTKEQTTFRLWAPTAQEAKVVLYRAGIGGEPEKEVSMKSDIKGTWIAAVDGDKKGKFYTYRVEIGEKVNEAVDPYAKAVGVNGARGMVVDLSETNPEGWENDKKPKLINFEDSIIYELHVRDLSTNENSGIINKGKFLGLTEKGTKSPEGEKTGLDHMIDLGITHVHLLPSFDYYSIDETKLNENKFNWGYDPLNYNVPEGSYSTDPYSGTVRIKEYKQAVKTLHDNGIRVVMDVVYNHTGKTNDSNLNLLVPDYYYRKNIAGKFSNGSGCGNETASERSMVRKMITDSVKYWATEYHIDGFRFDLMSLHDIETMNQIRAELDKVDPSIIIYGEGWTGGSSPLPDSKKALKINTPKLKGIAAFSDDIRDGIKGSVFKEKEAGFANGAKNKEESVKFGIVASTKHPQVNYSKVNYSKAPWANDPAQAINYVSAHDNNTLWDKINFTNPDDSEEEKIKIDMLSNAIVLTSQGIPFLHAGEEMLRTKNGNDNSYNAPDSINQLDWSRKSKYKYVYEYYKGLIALRKGHPAFRMTTTEEIQKNLVFMDSLKANMIGYTINNNANGDSWKTIAVVFNANTKDKEVKLPAENWAIVVDGKKAGVDVLGEVKGSKVTIPARSAMVFVDAGSAGISGIPVREEEKKAENITAWLIGIGAAAASIISGAVYYLIRKKRRK